MFGNQLCKDTISMPGMSFDQVMSTCRGCLSTERKLFRATFLEDVFKDLTGINISAAGELPKGLCYECSALLQKYARFKRKVIQSHNMLRQYIWNGTPVTSDGHERSHLTKTNVKYLNIDDAQTEQEAPNMNLIKGYTEMIVDTKIERIEVKPEEPELSDYEGEWLDDSYNVTSNSIPQATDERREQELQFESQVAPLHIDVKPCQENTDYHTPENFYQDLDLADSSSNDYKIDEQAGDIFEESSNIDNITENADTLDINKQLHDNNYPAPIPNNNFKDDLQDPDENDTLTKYLSNNYTLIKDSRDRTKAYQCNVCFKTFRYKSGISSHVLIHLEPIHKCEMCDKSYYRKSSLISHRRRHFIEKKFQCSVCMLKFYWEKDLARHAEVHTTEKSYKCHLCIKCYSTKRMLNRHMRVKHKQELAPSYDNDIDKPYKCNICESSYMTEWSLKRHTCNKLTEFYQCDICSSRCRSKDNLIMHLRLHFGEAINFTCGECGQSFNSNSSYHDHLHQHPNYKPYECRECKVSFKCEYEYRKHVNVVHKLPIRCEVCLKNFYDRVCYRRHLLTHTSGKKYRCDICMRDFFSKSYLYIHMRKHTGERPFKCDVCMKTFTAKVYLNIHMRCHTGEKPFQCNVCNRRFTQKNTLNTHSLIHTRNNPNTLANQNNTIQA